MSARREWVDAPAIASREVLGPMDEPLARYNKILDEADNKSALIDELARWPVLASDALEQAQAAEFDWDEWRLGLGMERRGKFAGETFARKYGAILMPSAMIDVLLVASQYHVPFGLAYLRMWEVNGAVRPGKKRRRTT